MENKLNTRFRPLRSFTASIACIGFCALLVSGCGGGGGSASAPPPPPPTPTFVAITLLAGSIGGAGNVDATGPAARFTAPAGVAVDAAGNAYVPDLQNFTIRKITSAGVVTILAGKAGVNGSQDGDAQSARLYSPAAVAVDSAGVVYVADGAAIRRVTAAGQVTTLAGVAGSPGAVDGTGSAARFDSPRGIAVDAAGSVYVADHSATIRKVTAAGVVTTVAGKAHTYDVVDGVGATARFFSPNGIAADGAGNLYVTDSDPSRINFIRKIAPGGVVTTLAGSAGTGSWSDGTGPAAHFNGPSGVAVDNAGNVYVADTGNQAIRKISGSGAVTTIAGKVGVSGSADGAAASATFFNPTGLAADASGNIFIADSNNNTIRKLTPSGVVATIAGTASVAGAQDGVGAAASMFLPDQVAVDPAGNTYVVDRGNVVIRKITPAGAVTVLAGTAGMRGSVDGTGAAARFSDMRGLAVDSAGNVYVADTYHCISCLTPSSTRNTIRKITPAGVVTTLAGGDGHGLGEFADGTGAAARFFLPSGLATDSAGNLYVADCGNGALRKITPGGVVTTLVRTGVCSATSGSNLVSPTPPIGLARDSAGNFYLSDGGRNVIRKIASNGVITIIAGTDAAYGAADGTGAAALFNGPRAVAVDGAGNAYVADTFNNAIRMVTPAGVVTTIAGRFGSTGIMLGSLPGSLSAPQGVAIDSKGVLIVSTGNGIVRIQ